MRPRYVSPSGRGKVEAPGERLVAADGLAQRARGLDPEIDGDRPAAPPHRDVRGLEHRGQEPVHILAAADGDAHIVDLRRDRPGVEGMLGEARAARLLAVAGVLPLGMNRLHLHVELVDEVEGELTHVPARAFAEQRALEQRLGDLLAGTRHRDGDPQRAPDALVLVDQDIEDDAVDGVVRAVPGDHPHLGLLLPEPVHPALALLVAGGVPGQVVVQDGIEVRLEVDAFGEAVGAHEHESAEDVVEERAVAEAEGVRNFLRRSGNAVSVSR